MTIVDFFDPNSRDHCRAYQYLMDNGWWPKWFWDTVPDEAKVDIPTMWSSLIQSKMAAIREAMTIRFTVIGRLAGSGSKTFMPRGGKKGGRPIAVPASKYSKGWMDSVRAEAAIAARNLPALMRGPVGVIYTFYCPRPKSHFDSQNRIRDTAPEYPYRRKEPDWDKLCRSTSDAMTGVIWHDDKQVVNAIVSVEYGEPMRCEIAVEELI